MEISPVELEKEILYNALVNLGNYYMLSPKIHMTSFEQEVAPFRDEWRQYNSNKPHIPRKGLSLTSLDGSMSGPDLESLREHNNRHNTRFSEEDFKTPTRVLEKMPSIREPIKDFLPFLGRTHLIKLGEGGFFPFHRDSQYMGANTFRLICLLSETDPINFCFIYDEQKIKLEFERIYFMNTKISHSVFSFTEGATFLVMNVILNRESVNCVIKHLESR